MTAIENALQRENLLVRLGSYLQYVLSSVAEIANEGIGGVGGTETFPSDVDFALEEENGVTSAQRAEVFVQPVTQFFQQNESNAYQENANTSFENALSVFENVVEKSVVDESNENSQLLINNGFVSDNSYNVLGDEFAHYQQDRADFFETTAAGIAAEGAGAAVFLQGGAGELGGGESGEVVENVSVFGEVLAERFAHVVENFASEIMTESFVEVAEVGVSGGGEVLAVQDRVNSYTELNNGEVLIEKGDLKYYREIAENDGGQRFYTVSPSVNMSNTISSRADEESIIEKALALLEQQLDESLSTAAEGVHYA